MSEQLRQANEQDAPALHGLLQRAYAPLKKQNIHFTITRASIADVKRVIRQETTFILEQSRQPIATLTLRFPWTSSPAATEPWPFLHWFAVDPQAGQQGIGSRLLNQVEEQFLRDQLKVPAVYLATAVDHPWLSGLYQRRGYQPFRHGINPLGVQLVYLRKVLDPEAYRAWQPPGQPATVAAAGITTASHHS